MSDASALRRAMRDGSRETWERTLARGLAARGYPPDRLTDAELLAAADGFDRRRCAGVPLGENLRATARGLDSARLRQAMAAADADANRRGDRRGRRKKRR